MPRQLIPVDERSGMHIQRHGKSYIDLSSNDYLGLSQSDPLKSAMIEATQRYGVGSTGSRLLSGDHRIIHELESELAEWKGTESALVFNSGFQMNSGIFSALFEPGTAFFIDRFVHASLIDGIRLSGHRFFRFPHQDLHALGQKLASERSHYTRAVIVTESVFSMDGTLTDIDELISIAEKHQSEIMIDEAHAVGVYGNKGEGLAASKGIRYQLGTFGKAMGGAGGFICLPQDEKAKLIDQCRSFIYSTALPIPVLATQAAALSWIQGPDARTARQQVIENTEQFQSGLADSGISYLGSSHIVPIPVGDADACRQLANKIQALGIWIQAILPPTVPNASCRLRASISASHTQEEIALAISAIADSWPK